VVVVVVMVVVNSHQLLHFSSGGLPACRISRGFGSASSGAAAASPVARSEVGAAPRGHDARTTLALLSSVYTDHHQIKSNKRQGKGLYQVIFDYLDTSPICEGIV
jgi:hypothetical protein